MRYDHVGEKASTIAGGRWDNIDMLRAIAILLVLVFHFTARQDPSYLGYDHFPFSLEWGWLGVDIFFAVSGFCIFMSLDSSRDGVHFLAKRMARIQPAYMAGVVATFLFVGWFGLDGREVDLMTMSANLLWANAMPGIRHVDGVYWSLVAELKFYLFVAILYQFRHRVPLTLAWLGFCVFGRVLLMAGGKIELVGHLVFIAHYAPAFLFGLMAHEWRRLSPTARWSSLAAGLALVATESRYEGLPALMAPALMAATVIALFARGIRIPAWARFIALISYPLYLVHQNIGWIAMREISPLESIWLGWAAAIAVTFGLAYIIHLTVENRFRKPMEAAFETLLRRGLRVTRIERLARARG